MRKINWGARLFLLCLLLWASFLFIFSNIYPVADVVREISNQKIIENKSRFLSLQQIPGAFQLAIIETEDRRFYSHFGIDPIGIVRSFFVDVQGDQLREGGSTITQQLIRNTILGPEKTFTRKIKEVVLSVALDSFMSKQEILDLYLNIIYFGHGAYGAGQAAQVYFGKSLSALSLPEWSLLAGLPNEPYNLDPYSFMNRAKERQKEVLQHLVDAHYISQQEADAAYQQKLVLKHSKA
ncbi:transglycosylase [Aneurinibacillus soli]|uniref:Penicillin-binding protein 1A n=1 Tax=Aneurinibacillus soli TaxID=1500254 RepID=A0A0U5BBM2_9BACL|nr:transglycosylase domain-containing protein [Aneurinibacillus soli]PYE64367.1 transglycosylase [Aneurinibacillus soli]BAU28316.1 Penicillin-binding protein 1A [Aneurinibacillus soli]